MKKVIAILSILVTLTATVAYTTLAVNAHPGRTDGNGGHTNHSTGEYHYHHGYSAHDHYDMDGDGDLDCPYDFHDKTSHSSHSYTSHVESTSVDQTDSQATEPTQKQNKKSSTSYFLSSDFVIWILALVFLFVFWILPIFFRK